MGCVVAPDASSESGRADGLVDANVKVKVAWVAAGAAVVAAGAEEPAAALLGAGAARELLLLAGACWRT